MQLMVLCDFYRGNRKPRVCQCWRRKEWGAPKAYSCKQSGVGASDRTSNCTVDDITKGKGKKENVDVTLCPDFAVSKDEFVLGFVHMQNKVWFSKHNLILACVLCFHNPPRYNSELQAFINPSHGNLVSIAGNNLIPNRCKNLIKIIHFWHW